MNTNLELTTETAPLPIPAPTTDEAEIDLDLAPDFEPGDYAIAKERMRALAISAGMSAAEIAEIEEQVRQDNDYLNAPLTVLENPHATEEECREAFDEWQRRWEENEQKDAERRAANREVLRRQHSVWDAVASVFRRFVR